MRAAEMERTEKVVNFLIGRFIDQVQEWGGLRRMFSYECIAILEFTKEQHYLANRQRLLALVEAAQAQEVGK